MAQDIDKLEAGIKSVKRLVKVGEGVMSDSKVDVKDLAYLPELFQAGAEAVAAFKHAKEMLEEGKDIDPMEAVRLVNLLFAK